MITDWKNNNYIKFESNILRICLDSNIIFVVLLSLLVITNITIFIDMFLARQIFSFLMFFILPGLLILVIIDYNITSLFCKLFLAISLSISFKYFIGLILNFLFIYFGYTKPLTFYPIVFSINIGIFLLLLISYYKHSNKYYIYSINTKKYTEDKLLSPLILPFMFPFLVILGTYYMELTKNNIFLMLFLSLVPIWFTFVTLNSEKNDELTYQVGILMISLSILLMNGLFSKYLRPGDITGEFEAMKIILSNSVWSPDVGNNRLLATLSVSLLPAIDKIILGIDNLYIYKLIYPILISFIPLGCYIIYRIYLSPTYSFISAFFYISQLPYIYSLAVQLRMGICLLFFISFFILYFDQKMSPSRSILLIIFSLSLIVSYYAMPVIFIYVISSVYVISKINSKLTLFKENASNISVEIIVLSFAAIFVWWELFTWRAFTLSIRCIKNAYLSLISKNEYVPSNDVLSITTIGNKTVSELTTTIINDLFFFIIGIGVLILLYRCIKFRDLTKFDIPYFTSMLSMFVLCVSFFVVPTLSQDYTGYRLYLVALVLLAPSIITPINFIPSKYNLKKIGKIILVILLVVQFMTSSFLLHQIMGERYSEFLNNEGDRYFAYSICESDVKSGIWIKEYSIQEYGVLGDVTGGVAKGMFLYVYEGQALRGVSASLATYLMSDEKKLSNKLIFLRKSNIESNLIFNKNTWNKPLRIDDYENKINSNNLIYNGGPKIYLSD